MSDTQSVTSVRPSASTPTLEEAYAEWDKAHAHIKSVPPTQERDYIKHAANLLTLLEPIAEISPFAKAAIASFKLVVLIEQDRRDNDARIEAVILAQAELMRALLDVDKLTKHHTDRDALFTMSSITNVFEEIRNQIKLCHNCMDTYRKQRPIAKLYKAREWKDKLMRFVSTFDDLRTRLFQTIGLQTASNVGQIVSDMEKILSLLFASQDAKEKEDIKKIDTAARETLNTNPRDLQSLLVSTEQPAMAEEISENLQDDGKKKGTPKPDAKKVASVSIEMQVNELLEDLRASVDTLCEKNLKYFEKILVFYTDQLKKSINDSADQVITSLSGPYARLQHTDLRDLWKEMKWLLCVETRIFGLALYEYYQDLYAHPQAIANDSDPGEDAHSVGTNSQNTDKYSFDSRFHPDAWTLPYLACFMKTSATIDDDNSGFIGISEANRFTSRIPEGWTLPQYCAYLVEGRHHESAIYRHRMILLRNNMHEMHSQLLPGNRFAAASVMATVCDDIIDKLALSPPSKTKEVSITPELDQLIKTRILEQDEEVRGVMKLFEYNLDKTMVDMLFRGQDLEQYMFPLAYALTELLLDFHHLCYSSTVDFRQWATSIVKPFQILRSIIDDRVKELKSQNSTTNLGAYHRGVWSWFDLSSIGGMTEEQKQEWKDAVAQDIYCHRGDMSFIVDFPIPNFSGDLVTRTYPTWEEFLEHNDASRVPEDHFAIQWSSGTDGWYVIPDYWGFFDLPIARICNKCHSNSGELKTAVYKCLECNDFDLCQKCYDKHPTEHEVDGHEFSHTVALVAAFLQESRRIWIYHQNEHEVERSHAEIKKIQTSEPSDKCDLAGSNDFTRMHTGDEEDADEAFEEDAAIKAARRRLVDLEKENLYACCVCRSWVTLESRFFTCGEYSCREGFPVCQKCALEQYDNVDTHFWWHSLLPFDKRVLHLKSDVSAASKASKEPREKISPCGASEQNGPPNLDLASSSDAQTNKTLANATGVETKILAIEKTVSDMRLQLRDVAQGTSEGLVKFDTLNTRLDAIESNMNERLSGIEAMMKQFLAVLASDTTPSGKLNSAPVYSTTTEENGV